MSNTQAPQAANQLLVSPYSTTVVSGVTPLLDSSASKPCWLTMSRRTLSFRSLCQEKLTAPGTWARSYRPGLTLTSITRTWGLSRFCASQSVLTSGPAGMAVAAPTAPLAKLATPRAVTESQAFHGVGERVARGMKLPFSGANTAFCCGWEPV